MKHPTTQIVPRNPKCIFAWCEKDGVRIICWDTNPYENDKYGWACEECATKNEVK